MCFFKEKSSVKGAGLERMMGIEPTYLAWEANVLPLNYTRISKCTLLLSMILSNKSRFAGKKTGQGGRTDFSERSCDLRGHVKDDCL